MADLIIPTNGTTPQTQCASSYFNTTTFTPSGAIRGDTALATTIQPVLQVGITAPIYLPDFLPTDELFAQLGNSDQPATAGTFSAPILAGTILSVSTSGSYPVQTAAANSLATGNTVKISGSATTPSIDGTYIATVIDSTHFTLAGIPAVTGSGAGGGVYLLNGTTSSNLQAQPFNVLPAALQTPLNNALSQLGIPQASVSQPTGTTGVYELIGLTNGAISSGTFTLDPTGLFPSCQWSVLEQSLGGLSAPYVVVFVMKQAPLAFSQFSTPLPGNVLTITGNTIANPTVVSTSTPHGLVTGQTVFASGSNSTPPLSGALVATVISPTTFSVPVNVTGAGTTGSVTQTGVSATVTQTGSPTANQVVQVALTVPNTYAGNYNAALTLPAPVIIASNTAASASVVTTSGPHLLTSGQTVNITGTNSTPPIDGARVATVLSPTTFSVPVDTSGGAGTASATFTLSATCGQLSPNMTSQQIGNVLAHHPYVNYSTAPNVTINVASTQVFSVQFTGSLGLSAVPAFTLSAIALIAPQGFSGTLSYNTIQLYEYSLTQTGQSFSLLFSVSRIRASGEKRTILGPLNYTVYKDNLNYLTAVNVSLPSALIYNPATGLLISPTNIQFFNSNFPPWFASLPTSLPASAGLPWNNGQSLSVS